MKRSLLSLLMIVCCAVVSWADSPLTSTDFHEAYAEHPMVVMAGDFVTGAIFSEGDLPEPMVKFLTDNKSPIDIRLAVVNKMGWDAAWAMQLVQQTVMGKCKAKDETQLAKKADAASLILYAYAKAMGDYFNVNDARELAHEAVRKNNGKSFTIDLIASLIDAQWCSDNDIYHMYTVVNDVINEYGDHQDMRTEAVNIIMDYMGLYTE
ncbi:MAG: hypothetical protein IJT30_09630 [Muribaculaceae bacterium]|nr:hypothetical protein [Muribaculaceae bacterium]